MQRLPALLSGVDGDLEASGNLLLANNFAQELRPQSGIGLTVVDVSLYVSVPGAYEPQKLIVSNRSARALLRLR